MFSKTFGPFCHARSIQIDDKQKVWKTEKNHLKESQTQDLPTCISVQQKASIHHHKAKKSFELKRGYMKEITQFYFDLPKLISQRKMSKTQQWKSSKKTQKYNSQRGQAQHKDVKTTHCSMQKKYLPCCKQACEQCMSCRMRNMH